MGSKALSLPPTPKKSVVDEYHGIQIVDDYRWLENRADPEVQQWNAEQNQYSRAWLSQSPACEKIHQRLKELYNAMSADYLALQYRRGLVFALKWQPPKEQPFLVVLQSVDDRDSERVVVDPNMIDSKGNLAIDFYMASLDGKLVAVCMSEKGSEDGTVYVFLVETGKQLSDVIPRVNYPTAGGSVAWNADASGFYYTRYPHANERPAEDLNFFQQVYFHKLGTPPGEDAYVIGKDFPRIAEIELRAREDGQYILATVANGDGGEFAHYVRYAAGEWIQVTRFADEITHAMFGMDDMLYLLSHQNAPRGKILRVPLTNPDVARAEVVVAESEASIQSFAPTMTRLYTIDVRGGPSEIRIFDYAGRGQESVPLEPVSSVLQILRMGGDRILFRSTSFITPPAWYHFDPAEEEVRRSALYSTAPVDFSDAEVVREFATARDGTQIPLNIIRRKGTRLDGSNPTLLTGYGGYGISLSPSFNLRRRVWLDQGGVFVVANLRGGGEYGEAWHKAGNLLNKQNVFDDLIACARYLGDAGYTNRDHLAIEGGSNGGLLMGAALTQHPELFRVVVAYVGVFDMLRVEFDPNGAFNVTEYGSVHDPEQFKALYSYSPYHRIVDGTAYPAVLFMTGENDGRVNPAQSRKMTARLQAASSSGLPILLWTSANAGHGMGSALDERIALEADAFTFLLQQLGIEFKSPDS